VFNVIYQPNSVEPELLISLDAQKAFDRIEYNYLFTALEKFGFGPTLCWLIKILYTAPKASIRTNGIMSHYFPLFRGTRQGCPLSPQIFDIAIEPLAIMLRETASLIGVQRGENCINCRSMRMIFFFRIPMPLYLLPWNLSPSLAGCRAIN